MSGDHRLLVIKNIIKSYLDNCQVGALCPRIKQITFFIKFKQAIIVTVLQSARAQNISLQKSHSLESKRMFEKHFNKINLYKEVFPWPQNIFKNFLQDTSKPPI